MLLNKKSHPLQWFSVSMGFTWVIMGLFALSLSAFLSASLTLGGFGWFLACLLMDSRSRRDIFGDRFEPHAAINGPGLVRPPLAECPSLYVLPIKERVLLFAGILGLCVTFLALGHFTMQVLGTITFWPFIGVLMLGMGASLVAVFQALDKIIARIPPGAK